VALVHYTNITPDNCHLSYLSLGMNIGRLQNATLVALALLLKKK
jgi:hypothetical protein